MKREMKWELLRAISCISVLLLHVAVLYPEEAAVYQNYSPFSFLFCDFLQTMTRTAVPCFVMLSGAFLLDKEHLDVMQFYRHSIRKLVIPTVVFGLGYLFVRFCTGTGIGVLLTDTLAGKPSGHFWFMFMLIGLYGVFPFLYFFKKNVSRVMFDWFSFGMVVLSCVIHFTCQLIWPVQFLEYLGYFLMGNYLRNRGEHLRGSANFWLLVSGCFLLMTFLLNEWQFYYGTYDSTFFRNPNFPTVIAASLAVFTVFSKLEISHVPKAFLKIAKHSMVIYLLHPLVINVICKIVKIIGGGYLPTPILYVPVLFAACMGITYALAVVMDKIWIQAVRAKSRGEQR